jgi:hypothetical protein
MSRRQLPGTVLHLLPETGVTDQGNYGNDGTYNGGMGVVGGEFVFDGVDDYVSVPQFQSDQSLDFSVSVWFSVDNTARIKNVIFANDGYSTGAMLMSHPWNGHDMLFYIKAGSEHIQFSIPGYANNTLFHVVITKVYADSYAKAWVNGVEVTAVNLSSRASIDPRSSHPFLLGAQLGYGYLDGTESDFRYFNRVITAGEVALLYNKGVPGYEPFGLLGGEVLALEMSRYASGVILDESGNGNNGTLTGGASVVGDAIVFDGVDGGITATVPAVIGDGSVSLWVKFDAIPSGTHVIFGAALGGSYVLINQYGSSLFWYWQTGSPGVSTPSAVSVGPLYHLVMVRSGSTMIGYIDGVQVGTAAATNNWGNGNISIGYWPGTSGRALAGDVSDVRVFDRALTPAEVAFLASAAEVEVPDTRGSVLAIMPSYDEWGNLLVNAVDFSGQGNPGTLTNMDVATDWVADTADGGVRALDFDGTNDEIAFASPGAAAVSGVQSLSLWFYARSITVANRPQMFNLGLAGYPYTGQCLLGFNIIGVGPTVGTSRLCFIDYNSALGGVSGSYTTESFGTRLNEWIHVVGQWDGTIWRTWIDGTEDTNAQGTQDAPVAQPTGVMTIGSVATARYFDGLIDSVLLYDRVLTSAEITLLAASRNSFAAVAGGNPVGILQNNIQSMRLGI